MADLKSRLNSLIKSGELPHALAFAGGNEESRLELADWLANTLDCVVGNGSLLRVESEGQNIKLEQAKGVLDFLSLSRLAANRLVILQEAQTLNAQAGNALLKVVEEPPVHSYFIFLTPSLSLLMPTLRSRVQAFRLPYAIGTKEASDPKLASVVEAAWQGLQKRDKRAWSELVDHVKDRKTATELAQLFQRTLREAAVKNPGQPQILKWWKGAFQLELDIQANLDRVLLFENFYYQAFR
jgi:DNA polymerase-3 subunit delta'